MSIRTLVSIAFLLFSFSITHAQKLPASIVEANFYVRTVHSGGGFPSNRQVNGGGEIKQNDDNLSEQYFLFLQTKKCDKKPEITSFSIGGINYKYEVVSVSSPIMHTNLDGSTEVLVNKTKNRVYQIKVGKAIFIQNQKGFKNSHTVMIEGKMKGKPFSYTANANGLMTLKAQ